jgi:hypothetical protein
MSPDEGWDARASEASLRDMADAESERFVKVIRHQCILCSEAIADDAPRTAILMFAPEDESISYQLDAHLDCLRRAAHPAFAERVDPAFFERFKRGGGSSSDSPDD